MEIIYSMYYKQTYFYTIYNKIFHIYMMILKVF